MVQDSDVSSTACYDAAVARLGYRPSSMQMARARRKAGVIVKKSGCRSIWGKGTPDLDYWKRRYATDEQFAAKHRIASRSGAERRKRGGATERVDVDALTRRLREMLWGAKGRDRYEVTAKVEDIRAIWEAQKGRCALTGMEMTLNTFDPRGVSIDRIDHNLGYAPDNLRLLTLQANRALARFGEVAFYEMCEAAVLTKAAKENS